MNVVAFRNVNQALIQSAQLELGPFPFSRFAVDFPARAQTGRDFSLVNGRSAHREPRVSARTGRSGSRSARERATEQLTQSRDAANQMEAEAGKARTEPAEWKARPWWWQLVG
jgi:hypothetical protein